MLVFIIPHIEVANLDTRESWSEMCVLLFHSFRNVCVVLELCEQIVNKLLRQGLGELADAEESDRGGDHTDNERRDPKGRTGNVP